jgi:hypothetical protein
VSREIRHRRGQGNFRDLPAQLAGPPVVTFPREILSLQTFGTDDDVVSVRLWARPAKVPAVSGTGIVLTRKLLRKQGSGIATDYFDDGSFLLISAGEMNAAFNEGRLCRGVISVRLSESFTLYNDTNAPLDLPTWEIETTGEQVIIADSRKVCPP